MRNKQFFDKKSYFKIDWFCFLLFFMNIRKATLNDLDTITQQAITLLYQHAQWDDYFNPAEEVDKKYTEFFETCISDPEKQLLVAEEKEQMIGYALGEVHTRPPIFQIQKIGFISDVFVVPEFRKLGVAKKFLQELKDWFKSKNLEYIEISVHTQNDIALKIWSKYGFEDSSLKKRVHIKHFLP
jgi:ribosomal protein S18 acetylase RimI-like enzyme